MKQVYVIPEDGFAAAIADVVRMPIDSSRKEYCVITRINVMERYRGKGYGRKILDLILADADNEGVIVYLEPVATGGLDQEELEQWYERRGFTWGAWHMRRLPVKGV